MFEVIVRKKDNSTDTWDCLTEHQAESVFFKARAKEDTIDVTLNEIIDLE